MTDLNTPKITLVGALPPPLGGVTIFLRRFIGALGDQFQFSVIDLRKVEGKTPNFDDHHISPFYGRILSLLWLQWNLLCRPSDIVHFHFSDIKGLIFASCLLGRAKTVVSLHHGSIHISAKLRPMLRLLSKRIRRKIHAAHALNPAQAEFYRNELGLSELQIFMCPTHISPAPIQADIGGNVKSLVSELSPYVLTSGVGEYANRFDLVLEYWKTRPNDGTSLIISTYGDSKQDYLERLQTLADTIPSATMIGPLPENDFSYLLKNAALYLRPAEQDSFGIAVADAVAFGTSVLASDACPRAPEVETFDRYDMDDMAHRMEHALMRQRPENATAVRADRSDDFCKFYTSLLDT